jgi:hypothetical protein
MQSIFSTSSSFHPLLHLVQKHLLPNDIARNSLPDFVCTSLFHPTSSRSHQTCIPLEPGARPTQTRRAHWLDQPSTQTTPTPRQNNRVQVDRHTTSKVLNQSKLSRNSHPSSMIGPIDPLNHPTIQKRIHKTKGRSVARAS